MRIPYRWTIVLGFLVQGTGSYAVGFAVMVVLVLLAAALILGCTTETRHRTGHASAESEPEQSC